MLRQFSLFSDSNVKDSTIENIVKYMEPNEFIRGQMIYKEGDTMVNGIYFITSGDFEVTTRVRPGAVDKNLNSESRDGILNKVGPKVK